MNTRPRYQYGCLTRRKRIRMEDVWQFRYYETTEKGQRCRRSMIIGTLNQLPTRADALCILERFRLRLNRQHRFGRPVSLDALIDHLRRARITSTAVWNPAGTSLHLNRWMRPRWGARLLDEVRPMEVKQLLRSLPVAPKTKVNLKSLFHLVYQHGRGWELTDVNPIELVRQRGASIDTKSVERT